MICWLRLFVVKVAAVAFAIGLGLTHPGVAGPQSATPPHGSAQTVPQDFERLWSLLHLDDLVVIMREEGFTLALASDVDLLGRPGGQAWTQRLEQIYEMDRLQRDLQREMLAALNPTHLDALCDFYSAQSVQNVVVLEVSVRRAFLDADVEDRARSAWLNGLALTAHEDAILHFVEVNDLIERNVVGALNSNYAFLRAMTDAHPVAAERMTDQQILAEVWAEEVEIRQDTSEWLFAFLTTAYDPVSEEVLDAYVAFSETDAGQALNHAIFAAFDKMYLRISADLGRAVGEFSSQQEL